MNVAAAFAARAAADPKGKEAIPLVRGSIFPVRMTPDLVAGDRFNIGVGFIDTAGNVHCKIAEDFSRLRCLYDDRVDLDSFQILRDIIHADLSGTVWTNPEHTPSENIEYGRQLPTAGLSIDEILDRSFQIYVPFGAPRDTLAQRTAPILTEKLRHQVCSAVAELAGDRAMAWMRSQPIKLPEAYGPAKIIRLPVHNPLNGTAADIVSAWSRQKATIRNQLTLSVANLLAIRYAEREARTTRALGLFVLAPDASSGYANTDLERIHETVDGLVSLARGADVHVQAAPSAQALAEHIVAWRPLAA